MMLYQSFWVRIWGLISIAKQKKYKGENAEIFLSLKRNGYFSNAIIQ